MLELTIVLVVLGTLVGLVYPRFTGPSPFAEASFADQVASGLRYAQRYAVSTGCEIQVVVDAGADSLALNRRSGGGEQACGSGAFDLPLNLPGQSGQYQVAAPDQVDVSAGLTVVFDSEGIPQAGGSTVIAGRSVTVEAGSGYVH